MNSKKIPTGIQSLHKGNETDELNCSYLNPLNKEQQTIDSLF